MWARDVARRCRDRSSQLLLSYSVASASSAAVCSGLVSAKSLRWGGGALWRMERVSSVRYLTVSVVAQNKAADSTYLMVIERWNPTSWSYSGVAFGTRNDTDGMSSRRT